MFANSTGSICGSALWAHLLCFSPDLLGILGWAWLWDRFGIKEHVQGWVLKCSSTRSTQRTQPWGDFPGLGQPGGCRERLLQLHAELPDVQPNPTPQTFRTCLFLYFFSHPLPPKTLRSNCIANWTANIGGENCLS